MAGRLLIAAVLLIFCGSVSSATTTLAYHGRIIKPNGNAFEPSSATLRIQIRSTGTEDCLMWEETYSGVDMTGTGGVFSLNLNSGTGTRTDGSGLTFAQVFGNYPTTTMTVPLANCAGGTNTITLTSSSHRVARLLFKDSIMPTFEQTPDMALAYVPFSMDSQTVGGFTPASLLRVEDASGPQAAAAFSPVEFAELQALIGGSSTQYEKAGELNGQTIPALSNGNVLQWQGGAWTAVTPITTETDPDTRAYAKADLPACAADEFLQSTGANTWVCAGVTGAAGGTVTSITVGSGLVDGSGSTGTNILTTGTIALPDLVTAGTGTKVTFDAKGRITASASLAETDLPTISTAGKISGDAITSGTIAGTTAINSSGAITTTANVTGAAISGSTFVLRDTDTNTITLQSPADINPSYTLTLPTTDGGAGEVLTTDGNGVLSWGAVASATGVAAADGTAGAPSISFGSDPDTGWFLPAPNTLAAATGGAERVRIDSTGKVGIGTDNPGNMLHLNGSGIIARLSDSGNSGHNTYIATGGTGRNVGAITGGVSMYGTYDGNDIFQLGYEASPTDTGLKFQYGTRNANINDGTYPAQMGFYPRGVNTPSLFMTYDGQVGVGTASPAAKLDIAHSLTAAETNSSLNVATTWNTSGTSTLIKANVTDTASHGNSLLLDLQKNGSSIFKVNKWGIASVYAVESEFFTITGGWTGKFTNSHTPDAYMLMRGDASNPSTLLVPTLADTVPLAIRARASQTADLQQWQDSVGTVLNTVKADGSVGLGTTDPGTQLDVAGAITSRPLGTATGETGQFIMRELAASGVNTATIRAPDVLAADYVLTLPANDGASGEILSTDGSGVLSWIAAPAATSVAAGAGTAAAPSMAFSGDADTGFYNTAADQIGVAVNGAQIFNMSSGGLTSPTTGGGTVTTAAGTAAAPTFSFKDDEDTGWFRPAANTLAAATDGAERVRIDSTGNVGIGTSSPTAKLEVLGTAWAGGTITDTSGVVAPYGSWYDFNPGSASTANYMNYFGGGILAANSQNSPTAGVTGVFSEGIHSGSGTLGFVNGGSFYAVKDGTGAVNEAFGVYAQIKNGNATGTIANAYGLYVDSFVRTGAITNSWGVYVADSTATNYFAGNVGIGTTSPLDNLEVVSSTSIVDISANAANVLDTYAEFNTKMNDVYKWSFGSYSSTNTDTNLNNAFYIYQNSDQGGTNNVNKFRIVINDAGNVGVGTTDPGTLLDVAGAITSRPLGTATGETGQFIMRELAVNGVNTASIRAPDVLAADYVLTLPANDGASGEILSTDGSGVLSWIAAPAATSVAAGAGTAAAPSISFSGDPNTGIYNSAADTLAFATGGVNRLLVSSSGLRFPDTGGSGTYTMGTEGWDDIATMRLSRNSVIQADSPDVLSYSTFGYHRFDVNSRTILQMARDGDGALFTIGGASTATPTTHKITTAGNGTSGVAGDSLVITTGSGTHTYAGSITMQPGQPQDWNGLTNVTGASMYLGGGSSKGNVDGGPIYFRTTPAGASGFQFNPYVTAMTIAGDGNVGIGTDTPGYKLDVDGSIHATSYYLNGNILDLNNLSAPVVAGGGQVQKITQTAVDAATGYRGPLLLQNLGTGGAYELSLASIDAGGVLTSWIRQDGGGYFAGSVGIGTDAPGTKLDVAGAITSRPLGTATGETGQFIMRELAANGVNTATIRAPDVLAADYVLTLPANDGASGEVLTTDGNGVLSWSAAGGGGQWTTAGSDIFYDTGAVGIGSTTPESMLDVLGQAKVGDGDYWTQPIYSLSVQSSTGSTWLELLNNTGSGKGGFFGLESDNSFQIWNYNGGSIHFYTETSASNGTLRMFIENNGNVAIGTSTPGTKLDVEGAITSRPLGTATGETGQILFRELAAGGTDAVKIRAPDALAADYVLTLPANDGASGEVLTTDGNGVLTWEAAGAGSSQWTTAVNDIHYMTGNVGIGTTTPDSVLVVEKNHAAETAIRIKNVDAGGNAMLQLINDGGLLGELTLSGSSVPAPWGNRLNLYSYPNSNGINIFVEGNDPIVFFTTYAERMQITGDGKVGIGTDTPGTLLDVAGGITSRPLGTNTGEAGQFIMRELAADGTDAVTIRAPDALAASYVLTFPVDDGAPGEVLTTDGDGVLTWTAGGGGGGTTGIALGTEGAPSISFTGDTDTGWWSPAADTLAASTGGTERIRIDSSGRVGIGTTVPFSIGKLTVQAGTDQNLIFAQNVDGADVGAYGLMARDDSGGGIPLALNGSRIHLMGAVGIGTDNPTGRLHVSLQGNQNLIFANSLDGSDAGASGILSRDDTGTTIPFAINASRFHFRTGDVGIGTDAPEVKLDVNGAIISRTVANAGSANIDFTTGNVQTSTNNTNNEAFNVCGLKDGGSYSLVLTAQPNGSTMTFNAFSDAGCSSSLNLDAGGVAFTTTSATTIVTFIRAGGTVYAMLATGFTQ